MMNTISSHFTHRHGKGSRRIAFILTPVEFGGAERVSLSFLQHSRNRDIDIRPIVLCRPWEEKNTFTRALDDLEIEYSLAPIIKRPPDQGRDPWRIARCTSAIYKELKSGSFDLVHTNGYSADIMGVAAAKALKLPVLSTCHGFISNTRTYRFYNFLDIIAFRFMHRVIAVSDTLKQDLVARGVAEEKIRTVHNAVETRKDRQWLHRQRTRIRDSFGIGPHEFLLGYVGRLSMEKGISFLLQALTLPAVADMPLRLLVLGEGPQSGEMQSFVRQHGLEKTVVFAGFQDDVGDFLPALDLFVLPSLTEGTSMALLEAMATGLPVVATAVGGTPGVVDSGENGLLVPSAAPAPLAEAVKVLYGDVRLRARVAAAGLQTVKSRFSIDTWLGKIDSIYDEILAECPARIGGDS